jgi:serine/threonine-protein kinase
MGPSSVVRSVSRTPAPEEIRAQLAKVAASGAFRRSGRMCRFLSLAVEHALADSGEPLKEYRVGVDVFDRRPDYDPRVDPIVRVEARRLRAKLKSYYTSAGKADAIIIDFPKGAYVPVFRTRGAPRAAARRESDASIAVLPFANLTPEARDDYFSDGLAEELNLLLTRVEGLRVVAWHSAAQLRGREEDLRAIRDRLKVGTVLRGAVRRTAGQVRVTVQLIDTGSGAVLWSEAYSRAMSAMFALQEEIARAIVTTLRVALPKPKPAAGVRSMPTLECYNLCLQGRFYANKRTGEGLKRSAACYAAAIEKDGRCALAYAGLSDAYSLFCDYGWMHPNDAMPKADAAALKALELDPRSADALATLAFIRSIFQWRWDEAEGLYRQAVAANPGNAKARHWFATDHLALLGRFDEALEQIRLARLLDPLSLIIHEGQGMVHMLARDFDAALATLGQLIELDPAFFKGYGTMGRVLSLMGRYPEAIAMFEKARSLAGPIPSLVAALGQTRVLAGDAEAGRLALEELARMAAGSYVPSTCPAVVHMALGETGRCLDWLERAVDQHQLPVGAFNVHPLYDPLRSEPRFRALVARMGLLP